jgi:hypothetical protein
MQGDILAISKSICQQQPTSFVHPVLEYHGMTLATPQFKVDNQLFESVQWHVTKTPSSLKTPPYHESLAVLKILTFVYQGKRDNVVTAFKYLQVNSSSSLLPINPHQENQETLQEN